MKLIIDIPERAYEAFKEWHKNKVANVEESLIANGIPYEERPQGDLISREALKEALFLACDTCRHCPHNNFEDIIDNAPTVESVKQCKYCKHFGNEDYCSNCHSNYSLYEKYER